MNDRYRMCHMTPKVSVELESGDTAELTLGDCMRVINQLMHHKFLQFDVDLPRTLMGRDIAEWEQVGVHGTGESCWQYEDDLDNLTITLQLDEITAIGGLPREEFRNIPKEKEVE
jgi:hypothetical protein